jgi:hypothetical protein
MPELYIFMMDDIMLKIKLYYYLHHFISNHIG